MIDLSGRTALVTGGSRGIGRATAHAFARAGANVVLAYRTSEREAHETAGTCAGHGVRTLAVRTDLSREEEVRALFSTADAFAPLDIVVANSGIWEEAAIEATTPSFWTRTIDHNLSSVVWTAREAARRMKPRGTGTLVLVASTAGQRGEAFHSAYAATKGALIALVRSLAAELGPHGIRVNAVSPGWVETDMTREAIARDRDAILAAIPLRRVAQPEDVAYPIVFLASPLARHINGAVLNVNGGSVLQ